MHVALLLTVLFYAEAMAVLDSSLVACGVTHVLGMREIRRLYMCGGAGVERSARQHAGRGALASKIFSVMPS